MISTFAPCIPHVFYALRETESHTNYFIFYQFSYLWIQIRIIIVLFILFLLSISDKGDLIKGETSTVTSPNFPKSYVQYELRDVQRLSELLRANVSFFHFKFCFKTNH